MSLFRDIIELERAVRIQDKINSYQGALLGKITHIKDDGEIRALQVNSPSNYVTFWLKPSSFIYQLRNKLRTGMTVVYCYPTMEIEKGVYFAVIDPDLKFSGDGSGGITEAEVIQLINNAIIAEDAALKAWVISQGYVTQSWVTGQNYTTLAIVQNWVNSQNFATQNELYTGLADERSWVTNQNYTTLASVQTWVNNQNFTTMALVQTWVNSQNFLNQSSADNRYLQTSTYNTNRGIDRVSDLNSFRFVVQRNDYTGGGDFAIAASWINRCVTFLVNDTNYPSVAPTANYFPQAVTGNPTPVEYKNTSFVDTKYRIICNSSSIMQVNDNIYIKNDSRFRHYVRGDAGSITVNGSSTTEYLISPLSQWRLTRTGTNTYTLTDVGYNFVPY